MRFLDAFGERIPPFFANGRWDNGHYLISTFFAEQRSAERLGNALPARLGSEAGALAHSKPQKGSIMRINKADVPVKIDVPGATARQALEFGDATGYSKMAGEYFSLAAGTDIAGLLKGLENDLCQSPHWGYLIEGQIIVTYTDGSEETVNGSDLFYWPPGHTVRAAADSEVILFSPQAEHCAVVSHLHKQLVQS